MITHIAWFILFESNKIMINYEKLTNDFIPSLIDCIIDNILITELVWLYTQYFMFHNVIFHQFCIFFKLI